jgi:hypothetical protein
MPKKKKKKGLGSKLQKLLIKASDKYPAPDRTTRMKKDKNQK